MEIAYKGFTKDLQSMKGRGRFQWEPGRWYEAEGDAKCHRNGFHCAENPLDCLRVYPYDGANRYYVVAVDGDIDDEGDEISAQKMMLIQELTIEQMLVEAVKYTAKNLKTGTQNGRVYVDRAKCFFNDVCIVVGEKPEALVVKCPAYIGLVKTDKGKAIRAQVYKAIEPGIYRIQEVHDAAEKN